MSNFIRKFPGAKSDWLVLVKLSSFFLIAGCILALVLHEVATIFEKDITLLTYILGIIALLGFLELILSVIAYAISDKRDEMIKVEKAAQPQDQASSSSGKKPQ